MKPKDDLKSVRESIYYSSGMYAREVVNYKGPVMPKVPYPKWFKK